MNSMRVRLLLTAAVAMTVLACVLGVLLHELVRADLYDSLDQSLETRARTLTALVEQDDEEIQLEWTDPEDMERARSALPDHYELRSASGVRVVSEGDVADFDWPAPDDTAFGSTTLTDGTRVRYAIVRFTPKLDEPMETPLQYDLLVAEPSANVESTLAGLRFWIAVTGLGGILLGGGLLFVIITRETAPLSELATRIGELDTSVIASRIQLRRAPRELLPVVTQLNDLLERLDAARTREREFTAGAAHELRTPLAGIRAKLDLALSKERSPKEHRAFAGECLDIAVGIQGVVERLLSLARLEAGEVLGEPQSVNARSMVEEAWRAFAEKAKERGVVFQNDVKDESVTAQRAALGVVLTNLLENAVNYADENGTIVVASEQTDDVFNVKVSNSAGGMSDADAKHALEPFWRSDQARSDAGVHAGLGLTLCRRLVEAMGGRFDVGVEDGRFVAVVELKSS